MSRNFGLVLALVCVSLLCLAPVSVAQDKPADKSKDGKDAEFKVPPEDAKKVNPLKSDASTLADGKKLFGSQCALCHGKDGDGKGDLAQDMKLSMHDYHDPATLKDRSDGELFYILSKGKGDMPGEGDRLSETQRWELITYIRSIAVKTAAGTQPAKDEKKPQ